MSHTKEPWKAFSKIEVNRAFYVGCAIDGTNNVTAITGYSGAGDEEESIANARRIVACVNACVGIPTDVLEDRSILKASADIMQQRDGLLAVIAEIEINADEVMEFDECVGMVVPIEDYKRLIEVAAKVRDEQ
jgi:hypothetical protein